MRSGRHKSKTAVMRGDLGTDTESEIQEFGVCPQISVAGVRKTFSSFLEGHADLVSLKHCRSSCDYESPQLVETRGEFQKALK